MVLLVWQAAPQCGAFSLKEGHQHLPLLRPPVMYRDGDLHLLGRALQKQKSSQPVGRALHKQKSSLPKQKSFT